MRKLFFYAALVITIGFCCFGKTKCKQDITQVRFRIINAQNGQDLVFGPTKIYDKNLIKFYSLNGSDTIFHTYGAGPNPNPGQDSLLFVNFNHRKKNNVLMKVSDSDIDTLHIIYELVDAAPCCPDYIAVKPDSFNNKPPETLKGGITILKK